MTFNHRLNVTLEQETYDVLVLVEGVVIPEPYGPVDRYNPVVLSFKILNQDNPVLYDLINTMYMSQLEEAVSNNFIGVNNE
jgi:hypothetical protein